MPALELGEHVARLETGALGPLAGPVLVPAPIRTRPSMPMLPINDLKRHHQACSERTAAAVQAVLDSGWYVLGPQVTAFETAFAAYCGVGHCVGVGNGTDAIELALRALGLAAGDKVLLAANAGMYATGVVLGLGCVPVFVDVDEATQLLGARDLAACRDPGVRAVLVTHLYGRMVDMAPVVGLCRERSWLLVEDCAQAHGARRDGRVVGSFGDAATFSFYPTKNLGALGDGGAVTTASQATADRLRALRQYGWTQKYVVEVAGGRNTRLDELQAAILLAKLPDLDRWNARRRDIASRYRRAIVNPAVVLPPDGGDDYVGHLFVLRCRQRDALKAFLAREGIASDIHYPVPDHRQPALRDRFAGTALPVTERLAGEVLTLPCFPELLDTEVDAVAAAVNRWQPQ
jgi:aminotransferase EvaB